jgi:hypothetical protein
MKQTVEMFGEGFLDILAVKIYEDIITVLVTVTARGRNRGGGGGGDRRLMNSHYYSIINTQKRQRRQMLGQIEK